MIEKTGDPGKWHGEGEKTDDYGQDTVREDEQLLATAESPRPTN